MLFSQIPQIPQLHLALLANLALVLIQDHLVLEEVIIVLSHHPISRCHNGLLIIQNCWIKVGSRSGGAFIHIVPQGGVLDLELSLCEARRARVQIDTNILS
jgi:hypothetical protein